MKTLDCLGFYSLKQLQTTPQHILLTNNLRVIRHAWHFCYASVLVIKVLCGSIVLRASHLNWALCLIT
ncbi:TPA: hypothetical protein I7239_20780 [Vibrio vulnificus]|nr:hypothetical protein [Vibrio vulnificus]